MSNAKPGQTLELLRAQIRAVRSSMRDASRRIEALVDGETARNLTHDMIAEGNPRWQQINIAPKAIVTDRIVTGLEIDGAEIVLSNQVTGIKVTATDWPRSTFA